MRRFLLIAAAPLLSLSSLALAASPVLVTAPVHKAFVPLGFDDNDDAEVVLHGEFANTCYKVGPATASVDVESRKITIDAKSYFYQGDMCATVVIPFIQSVKLGPIPAGDYDIAVVGRPDAETRPLTIAPAHSRDPDDFLYAPVEQVTLETGDDGQRRVVVEGQYPLMFVGCMKIVELRERVTPGQVIVVQPIAQIFDDDAACPDRARTNKFRVSTAAPDVTERAEYLAHVRVLEGQSVNRLIDLRE